MRKAVANQVPAGGAGIVVGGGGGGGGGGGSKKNTLAEITRLQKERDARRAMMEQQKNERAAEEQRNKENGTPGDVDFQRMIRLYRETAPDEEAHAAPGEMKICICVRKRPISSKEVKRNDHDSITCLNPTVTVHDCKLKVDGISKYLDNTSFEVDHSFHEENTTEEVYHYVVQPLVGFVANGGRATVFAYGQTGSGKTFTMQGIQSQMVSDLYDLLLTNEKHSHTVVHVSYFEIYGGRCQDLLNNRQRLNVREDGTGEVVVGDLLEIEADGVEALQTIIETGNRNRTTHATESNDESSRSHAICQIALKVGDRLVGRLSLIDLAGSERGADTKSHNRQRRLEGAEINKSLLALKECIRALDSNSSHVPYRASKLTLVLKDSFTREKSRTVMIANISPAASSADHTLNTLRYADRIKERLVGGQAAAKAKQVQAGGGGGGAQDRGGSPVPPSSALPTPPPSSNGIVPPTKSSGIKAPLPPSKQQQQQQEAEDEEEILHQTVQHIFDEEEALLNLHMNIIQENAELLTEEGAHTLSRLYTYTTLTLTHFSTRMRIRTCCQKRVLPTTGRLLQQIQSDDNDIDAYASRLEKILERKSTLIEVLKQKLSSFRQALEREETLSKSVSGR